MEPLIAFLIGVAVTVLVASLTVLITLRVRNYFEEGEDSGRGGRKGKKTGRGKRGGPKVTPDKREGEYTIRFRDAGSSGKTWTCQIDDELIIGRGEDCDIQLSDKSVSRPHCKIFIGENGLEVADLGAKHRTKRNGVFVYSGSPLERGDTLRLGREELLVESIRHLGREEPERRDDAGPDATSDVDGRAGTASETEQKVQRHRTRQPLERGTGEQLGRGERQRTSGGGLCTGGAEEGAKPGYQGQQ